MAYIPRSEREMRYFAACMVARQSLISASQYRNAYRRNRKIHDKKMCNINTKIAHEYELVADRIRGVIYEVTYSK